jgi:beta-lactamase class A
MASVARRRKKNLPILSLLSTVMVLGAAALLLVELIQFSQQDSLLATGVRVAGIDVSGETQRDAVIRWQEAYEQPLTLYYGEHPIILQPGALGFRINSDTMLASALNATETAANFWMRFFNHLTGQQIGQSAEVPLSAEYQQGLLNNFLEDIAARYDRAPGTPGYDVSTLTVYQGTLGSTLDIAEATRMIDIALRDPINRTVNLPIGDSAASRPNINTLRQMIVDYLDSQGFIYDGQASIASVFILDLQTGEELNLLGDVAFSAASTIKVPILIDFYRFKEVPPDPDEAYIMANSLLCSRNSSSNLLMRLIGGGDEFTGIQSVTSTAQALGARNTYIAAPFVEGTVGQTLGSVGAPETSPNPNFNTDPDPFNQTTAEDIGTLFNQIYDCANYGSGLMVAFPNGEFTQNECRQMLELMSANNLLRLLQGGIPEDIRISHKNGWLTEMVGDAGIVFSPNGRHYVIAVYLWEDTEFQNYERLWPLMEGISRAAWNYFNPEEEILIPREGLPRTAQDCEGNYLPPVGQVNLDDIWSWRSES